MSPEKLARLPNGNSMAPSCIKNIVKIAGKGVAIRDASGNIIEYMKEPDPTRQDVIADTLLGVVNAGRHWQQPDWKVLLADNVKPAEQKIAAVKLDNKVS